MCTRHKRGKVDFEKKKLIRALFEIYNLINDRHYLDVLYGLEIRNRNIFLRVN